jgi:hypothetical protein
MTTETLHRRHTGRLLQSQPVGVKRPPWTWVCEQLRREPRNLTLKARRAVGVSNWRTLAYLSGHIGGSFSTSMAPWRLHRQVAVSYFQTAPDADSVDIKRRQNSQLKLSKFPKARLNPIRSVLGDRGFSIGEYCRTAPPPPSSPSRSRNDDRLGLRSRRPRIACLA